MNALGVVFLQLEPGNIDNPWFDQSSLPEKREADYKRDPDEPLSLGRILAKDK